MFLLFSATANSQDSTGVKNEIDLSLISPLNYAGPHIAVGYYRFIKPDLQIGLDIGYGGKETKNHDATEGFVGENYNYFTVKPEVRFFLDQESTIQHFIGVEAFYMRLSDQYLDSHYFTVESQAYEFEKADYRRVKYGANFLYGFKLRINRYIAVIQENGIGLRMRSIDYHNVQGETESNQKSVFAISNFKKEGNTFMFNFFFDLKLAITF